jgi:hypothetical protein
MTGWWVQAAHVGCGKLAPLHLMAAEPGAAVFACRYVKRVVRAARANSPGSRGHGDCVLLA